MSFKSTRLLIAAVVLGIILVLPFTGCSSHSNPAAPQLTQTMDVSGNADNPAGNTRMLWGLWSVEYDASSGSFHAIPLRGAMMNVNAVLFLQPPAQTGDLISFSLNPGTNLGNGYVDLDVTIRHPFFGVNKFRGFDVRGTVMAEGNIPFGFDNSAVHSGPGDVELLNADGWTRWWNPTEFTTYNTIFGYTPGSKALPGYFASSMVNPYKYFADSLDKDTPLSDLDQATRGTFATSPGINTRQYILQFPKDGGPPDFRFNYAIDASWAPPNNDYAPQFPVEAFPPKANMAEAWQIRVDDTGSTAWYVDDSNHGGALKLSVAIFDWQGKNKPNGVADEVSAIWLDSSVLASPVDIMPMASPINGDPGSSVWDVDITSLNLTASGDFDLWVGVRASSPANYAPQGGNPDAFDWPDVPLMAYLKTTAHISNTAGGVEILQVVPNEGEVSTVVNDVHIIGSNFLDGATVEFRFDPSTTLDVSNVTWVDSGLLTCDVDCTGPLGYYDVTVTNPDLQQATLDNGFRVVEYFECNGGAHDWVGNIYALNGVPPTDDLRFDTAIFRSGPHAGMALFQTSYYDWALFDPEGGPNQTIQPFMTGPYLLIMDVEIDETTGRLAILGQNMPRTIYLYDDNGNQLGEFEDPNLDQTTGTFTALDFDKNGDLWVVTKTGSLGADAVFEIRHYSVLDDDPFYSPVLQDTVDITESGMTGPPLGLGIGDIGISFYLHRLFVFSANTQDGGSNRLTSWDLNVSPPVKLADLQDPYPPYTRHNIFGNTGALSRMEVDVDHRFPEDKHEQCKIYLFASVYNSGDLDNSIIRVDGDLNILDNGEPYVLHSPFNFDVFPQCAVINDWGPSGSGSLISVDWATAHFTYWPVPADW